MFQSGLSCARSRWAKAIACVVGLATIGGTVSEARAGKTIAYYRFENGTAGDKAHKIDDADGGKATQGRMAYGDYSFTSHTPVDTTPRTGEPNLLAGHFGLGAHARFDYGFPLDSLINSTIEFWIAPRQELGCSQCPLLDLFVSFSDSDYFFVVDFAIDTQRNWFVGLSYIDRTTGRYDIARSNIPCYPGEWCFIALVKSGKDYAIYINNRKTDFKTRLAATGTLSAADLKPSTYWTIRPFEKKLDEIRLSNEALRPSEFLVKQPKLPE